MIQSKDEFLLKLERALPANISKGEIIAEYSQHIDQMLISGVEESEIFTELGNPSEIANLYKENVMLSHQAVQRYFIFCNLLFFIAGITLTVGYHVFDISLISNTWQLLTGIPFVLIICYCIYWAYVGYQIGREYGFRGEKLVSKTVIVSLVPNIILMIMTLFNIVPTIWFEPVLTPAFVFICVIMTGLIYPISKIGYKIGVYQSL